MKILAIESSCDETAAAVIETNNRQTTTVNKPEVGGCSLEVKVLSNVIASQIDLHRPFGGVFPEHASRAHAEKIIPVVAQAFSRQASEPKARTCSDIDLIAVTVGPGLIGSLLVGVNFAKTLAYASNKPIIGINHWLGHIYSNWNISKLEMTSHLPSPISNLPLFPSLHLIVSGGHTGLVLMKSHNDIQPLGQTLDDAAGEAFDKVAKLLQLGYPGGPAIAKAAEAGIKKQVLRTKLPRPMMDSKDYNFSFSGLKTAVLHEVKSNPFRISHLPFRFSLAAEFQQAVIDVLIAKTIKAAYEFRPKSIGLCGGVSANKELREQTKTAVSKLPWRCSHHVPEIIMSTDNAAMIGIAAAYQDKSQWTTFDKINADANLKL